MELTRKTFIRSGSAAVASLLSLPALATLSDEEIETLISNAKFSEDAVTLDVPEIAENGYSVPISVDAPGATSISVFSDGNPLPNVVTFKFGPLSGSQAVSTRIRLAKTQELVAVATMEDGTLYIAKKAVRVTIGGCGA